MSAKSPLSTAPLAFQKALQEAKTVQWRPEVKVEEIPPPTRIAPFAYAMSAEVTVHKTPIGEGRLILLHNPSGNPAWDGTFRCVTYAKTDIEPEMVTDPLLPDAAWSWLIEALHCAEATYCAPAGTVTAVASKSFGEMADDPTSAQVELRASWTPMIDDAGELFAQHLTAWGTLLCLAAGLPPLPAEVAVLPRSLRR